MSHDLGRPLGSASPNTIDPARLAARRTVGCTPTTATRTREEELDLERRVRIFLDQRSVPSLRRLAVEAAGTSVVLRGTVRSYYEKQLALHCCQRVAGVLDVVDAIEVNGVGSSTG